MSTHSGSVQPPPIAVWLVILFSSQDYRESILGDMLEEFSHIARHKGIIVARRWYWRQTATTIPHLFAIGFRGAPWTIAAIIVGAFVFRWYVSVLTSPSVNRAIDGALDKYQTLQPDGNAYVFWVTSGMLIVRLLLNLLVGFLVAVAAKGREMPATFGLALLSAVLAIHATLSTVVQTGDYGVIWTLVHTIAFSVSMLLAAAAVRYFRLRKTVG